MSADSVRRVTEGWGGIVEKHRNRDATRANTIWQVGEGPCDRRIEEVDPIEGQGNVSTDGTMVLIREEGWKEIKLTAISEVQVHSGEGQRGESDQSQGDPRVDLRRHSYQAGLWDANTMGLHQYAEGIRRGLDRCHRLSSVNDAAPWIERITLTNFPEAVQVVDWSHASERLWAVANAVHGKDTPAAKGWVRVQLDRLWEGRVGDVVGVLEGMTLDQDRYPPEVCQAPGYFRSHQAKMHYDVFREEGYPIGSGTVESGANSVVQHRMRRPGRGWHPGSGQAMLAVLSELHSGRFHRAWQSAFSLSD